MGAVMRAAALLALLACSCGDGEDTSDQRRMAHGFFEVILAPDEASIQGSVYDGPTPSGTVWEEADAAGGCVLLTPRVPFCEERCGSDAVCVEDDTCQPYPSRIGVGTVRVEGVRTVDGDASFDLDPVDGFYLSGDDLAFPPFAEGEEVTFTVEGSSCMRAFSMTAPGIAPLVVADATLEMLDGEPILLEWTPMGLHGITTIHVVVDISHHGGTRGKISCEVPDTGTLEIPATLLDRLKALGVSGFPRVSLTRMSVGPSRPSVQVYLLVRSTARIDLSIPGLTSCVSDEDCPDGQVCLPDARCG
jgi:hypothetical protein